MDEIALINEAKKGNKSALSKLLEQNYSILKGYVIKMTGNIDISQDIIQETMLKACLKISGFKPEAKFSTWLITIATNTYKDILRKNKFKEISLDDFTSNIISEPYNTFEDNIEKKEIMKILLSIPYKKRAAFILKHYYGYKYEEIAKILRCPKGTVKSRVNSCIKYITSEVTRRRLLDE